MGELWGHVLELLGLGVGRLGDRGGLGIHGWN
jgi:hypothetical protein